MQGVNKYAKLYRAFDYTFNDTELLKLALTHRSAAKSHNERLEFLGDAVLGMVIAEALYIKFPTLPEGNLTRMRSTLVKGETLAEIAKETGVGDLLKLGQGELKSGGFRRSSILADVVEAILGAIYLEAGFTQVKQVILHIWQGRISQLDPHAHPKDNKTRLQEYLQSKKIPLPLYEVVEVSGKDHAQTFTVKCQVESLSQINLGVGTSRRKAEQESARITMEKLENDK